MFRLASFFAITFLTLAANALAQKSRPALLPAPARTDGASPPRQRISVFAGGGAMPFHARFSLN